MLLVADVALSIRPVFCAFNFLSDPSNARPCARTVNSCCSLGDSKKAVGIATVSTVVKSLRALRTCAITSTSYRTVPGGATPRRLNVNGIKTAAPTSTGDSVSGARSPSSVPPTGDGSASCFTLSPSSISGSSTATTSTRTLPYRAAVPPPPPPKPSWPTASRQRAVKEDCREVKDEQHTAARHGHHVQSERSTLLEDGGLMSTSHSVPVTTWDQSAAMPMLLEETTTDDVNETRATAVSSAGSGCSGGLVGGKLAMFFLVGIPVIGVVAAALAWFYSCRQVSSSKQLHTVISSRLRLHLCVSY